MSRRITLLNQVEPTEPGEVCDKAEALRQVYQSLANGSKMVVNVSGGKDGLATLLIARYEMNLQPEQLIVHYQILPEAWPGTYDYIQGICQQLGVVFWSDGCDYGGYECSECGFRYTSVLPEQLVCPKCKTSTGVEIGRLQGVLDLVEHRQMWPDSRVRFCTDYTKIRVFNRRMKQELATIGPTPIVVLGERWRESNNRRDLPWLRERPNFNTRQVHMLEYRPILNYRRIETFRKLRQYGITPHYAYFNQGMTDHQMYELDQEGGPRCSCVMCVFAQSEHVRQAYKLEQVKPIIDRGIAVEAAIHRSWKYRESLTEAVQSLQVATLNREDFL